MVVDRVRSTIFVCYLPLFHEKQQLFSVVSETEGISPYGAKLKEKDGFRAWKTMYFVVTI